MLDREPRQELLSPARQQKAADEKPSAPADHKEESEKFCRHLLKAAGGQKVNKERWKKHASDVPRMLSAPDPLLLPSERKTGVKESSQI